jgi:hypothetical protein
MKIALARAGSTWACVDGTEKLLARAKLPGAHAFDRATHGLGLARAAGVPVVDLLPLAFASSWLVNSAIPSPVFRRWLSTPAVEVWSELVPALAEGGWEELGQEDRATLAGALGALGEGVGAISKVLATLVPAAVPLMPDAALFFAAGSVACPQAADAQTAGVEAFAPTMDWFSRATKDTDAALVALGRGVDGPPLLAAQVLDRLLWFDSVGYRHFKGWSWVRDGEREGVVKVAPPAASADAPRAPIDLGAAPVAFREAALAALG